VTIGCLEGGTTKRGKSQDAYGTIKVIVVGSSIAEFPLILGSASCGHRLRMLGITDLIGEHLMFFGSAFRQRDGSSGICVPWRWQKYGFLFSIHEFPGRNTAFSGTSKQPGIEKRNPSFPRGKTSGTRISDEPERYAGTALRLFRPTGLPLTSPGCRGYTED